MTTIDSSGENEPGKCIYHITVITGNVRLAGTDAQVFIEIIGDKGITSVHKLNTPNKSKREFERDQTNHFHIFDINVGQIRAIRIFHDNSGTAPGWFLDAVLIKSVSTAITGNKEKHDAELKDQLEKLRKKFKARELKLNIPVPIKTRSPRHKRSQSAELKRASLTSASPSPVRSSSAEPQSQADLLKSVLKKNLEQRVNSGSLNGLSRSSPTSSILKTSSSPRGSRTETRKQVKFNKEIHHHDSSKPDDSNATKSQAPKLEMKIHWFMSVYYNENKLTKNIKSIENFDKSLKNTDEKLLDKYYETTLKKVQRTGRELEVEESKEAANKRARSASPDNFIYVFECKNWLAKDMGDRKIERIIKVKSILKN